MTHNERVAQVVDGGNSQACYAIQAGALRTNPNSGPDGVGVQEDIAYTLEARAEVQAVYGAPANDNRQVAESSNASPKGLRFLSVCSGIEAASVAWPQWEAVAFAEIEKFPSAVLAHHYPDVPNLGDFTKIDTTTLGRVDILCGGTPCQAFSVAGQRRSLDDARGNLTLSFVELAHELAGLGETAGNGLRNVVWENVVGVLSTKDNAFGCFLAALVGADAPIEPPSRGKWGSAGLVAGPKGRAAWRVCDAQYWGVAQRRRRVIVVAEFGSGADPAEVLFEREGVQRHTPPSREKGKDVAPTISARPSGGGGLGTDFDLDGGLVHAPEIARCVATREGSSQDYETTTMLAVGVTGEIAHTLKAEGADASEDGTGRGTPIVAFDCKASGQSGFGVGEVASTMRSMGHTKSHQNGGGHLAVAIGAFKGGQGASAGGIAFDEYVSPTLSAADSGSNRTPSLLMGSAVRRLTPVECERLQGFPDSYTAIPWRGKPADQCPDGPRYKALGNSWAVPLFTWLGHRIDMHMPSVATSRTVTAANDNKIQDNRRAA